MSKTRKNWYDIADTTDEEQQKHKNDIKRFEERRKAKKRANAVRSKDWRALVELEDE